MGIDSRVGMEAEAIDRLATLAAGEYLRIFHFKSTLLLNAAKCILTSCKGNAMRLTIRAAATFCSLAAFLYACRTADNGSDTASSLASAGRTESKTVNLLCIRDGGGSNLPRIAIDNGVAYVLADAEGDGGGTRQLIAKIDVDQKKSSSGNGSKVITYTPRDGSSDFWLETSLDSKGRLWGDVKFQGRRYDATCDSSGKKITYEVGGAAPKATNSSDTGGAHGGSYEFACSCAKDISAKDCDHMPALTLTVTGDSATVTFKNSSTIYTGNRQSEEKGQALYRGFHSPTGFGDLGEHEAKFDVYLDTDLLTGNKGHFIVRYQGERRDWWDLQCKRT